MSYTSTDPVRFYNRYTSEWRSSTFIRTTVIHWFVIGNCNEDPVRGMEKNNGNKCPIKDCRSIQKARPESCHRYCHFFFTTTSNKLYSYLALFPEKQERFTVNEFQQDSNCARLRSLMFTLFKSKRVQLFWNNYLFKL